MKLQVIYKVIIIYTQTQMQKNMESNSDILISPLTLVKLF